MDTRAVSTVHENNVAKRLGGRRTANSGATAFSKGDVVVGNILIECKTKMTSAKSIGVQKSWIDEINEEKIGMGKAVAALAISFDCGENSYYVIDEKTMKMLVDMINGDG